MAPCKPSAIAADRSRASGAAAAQQEVLEVHYQGPIRSDFDVALDSVEFATEVTECLMLKAFCIIDARMLGEVYQGLPLDGFVRPAEADGVSIAEGLLGVDGSAFIATPVSIAEGGEAATELVEDSVLKDIDMLLESISEALAQELPSIGAEASCRTVGILHEASPAWGPQSLPKTTSESEKLTEDLALRWLDVFARHRLMLIYFLGPGSGTLELSLFDHPSSATQRVSTGPGTMVILRPEVISRRHFANGVDAALALSCFLLTEQNLSKSSAPPPPPYSEALMKWLEVRERNGATLDLLPKDKQQLTLESWPESLQACQRCVLAEACKLPASWSIDGFCDGVGLGVDLVIGVPFLRFDVNALFYEDREQDSWRQNKTYSRHASFIDGADLFDNTSFGMSSGEAKHMPPSITSGLEVSKEALQQAGFGEPACPLNADVQVGMHAEENLFTDQTPHAQAFALRGTSGSWAEEPNRISFALGLTGRSCLFDTDGSSSFAALVHGHSASSPDALFSLVVSSAWNLAPHSFAAFCSRDLLSAEGRCWCFDASADGFVRAEGCGAMLLARSPPPEAGGGEGGEAPRCRGLVRSTEMLQSGQATRTATAAPAVVAMHYTMAGAAQRGSLALGELDAVEAHAPGAELFDAAEAAAVAKVFPRLYDDENLVMTSIKSVVGSGYAAAGIFALLAVLSTARRAAFYNNNLLRDFSPSIDPKAGNLLLLTEVLKHPVDSPGYTCINSFGSSGTYVSAFVWGDLEASAREPRRQEDVQALQGLRPQVRFWPGGCGDVDPDVQPSRGYYIVGTFNQWSDPLRMEIDGQDSWTAVITLSENRWEQFQIWVDGDEQRVLHPGHEFATRSAPVHGPDDRKECFYCRWHLDGRPVMKPLRAQSGGEAEGGGLPMACTSTRDVGEPGDQYKVRLSIAGRFRNVDWEKLPDRVGEDRESPAASAFAALTPASYSIVANWTDWAFSEMSQEEDVPGVWSKQVRLKEEVGVFAIVRNRDWSQVIYPEVDDHEGSCEVQVCGPDDLNEDRCWMIRGAPGMAFVIEFQRVIAYKSDDRKVCWRPLYGSAFLSS